MNSLQLSILRCESGRNRTHSPRERSPESLPSLHPPPSPPPIPPPQTMLLPLLAATSLLPLSVLAHSHYSNAPHSHANSRKTLSFGPAHPHAKFHTHHHHTPSSSHAKRQSVVVKDGLEVAKEWLRNELPKGTQWFVRDDVSSRKRESRLVGEGGRSLVWRRYRGGFLLRLVQKLVQRGGEGIDQDMLYLDMRKSYRGEVAKGRKGGKEFIVLERRLISETTLSFLPSAFLPSTDRAPSFFSSSPSSPYTYTPSLSSPPLKTLLLSDSHDLPSRDCAWI